MRRIKAHIHRANKKRTRNSDAEKLDDIQQHLTQQKFNFIREREFHNELFSTRNHIRVPDLSMRYGNHLIVIELDGGIHGSLEMQSDRTKTRNADYNRAHIIYILLNEEQAHGEDPPLDIVSLADYRVREVLCKLESGEKQ